MTKKKKKSKAEYIAEAVHYGLDVDPKISISALKNMISGAKKDAGKGSGEIALNNPKHELFCHLFSGHNNSSLFGNGTQCYLHSHGGKARINDIEDKLSEIDFNDKNFFDLINKLKSEKQSIYNTANSNSAKLLVNTSIRARCTFLINEFIGTDDDMDTELKFVAMQRYDLKSKVLAIKEYNRVQERVSEKFTGEIVMSWDDGGMGKNKK